VDAEKLDYVTKTVSNVIHGRAGGTVARATPPKFEKPSIFNHY
jgi:hypothetical protein